jgi:hypothetical protein
MLEAWGMLEVRGGRQPEERLRLRLSREECPGGTRAIVRETGGTSEKGETVETAEVDLNPTAN